MLYELITLNTVIFGAPKMAPALEQWCTDKVEGAKFLGAWGTDIGQLNQIFILRSFENFETLNNARAALRGSENPFGCSEFLVDYNVETFEMFDFLPEVTSGQIGPVFEFRTYVTKNNGLFETREKWRQYAPKRAEYSPLISAMYAIDGAPRLTQIWAYKSLEERAAIRAKTVADGIWPPKGGPDWLSPKMSSSIAMPLAFSPLK
jgi:hypothetical protein